MRCGGSSHCPSPVPNVDMGRPLGGNFPLTGLENGGPRIGEASSWTQPARGPARLREQVESTTTYLGDRKLRSNVEPRSAFGNPCPSSSTSGHASPHSSEVPGVPVDTDLVHAAKRHSLWRFAEARRPERHSSRLAFWPAPSTTRPAPAFDARSRCASLSRELGRAPIATRRAVPDQLRTGRVRAQCSLQHCPQPAPGVQLAATLGNQPVPCLPSRAEAFAPARKLGTRTPCTPKPNGE